MKPFPHTLSWSAILAGWGDQWMTVQDLRAIAEERLLAASGEELILLSELVSCHKETSRADAQDLLQRLADREDWPRFFALREWQVVRLRWALAHLDDIWGEEELEVYNRLRALEEIWEDTGKPMDMPLLRPFLRSYAEMTDDDGGLNLTVRQLQDWVAAQEALLTAAQALREAAHHAALHTLALSLENFQTIAQQRIALLDSENGLLESLALHRSQEVHLRVSVFNAEQLKRRRQQVLRQKASEP